MLPVLLLIGVVGPIVTLLFLGWFIYVVRAPRSRIPYIEPQARPAQLVAGVPVYPAGEPYCVFDQLILPNGSTTCPTCGREAAVPSPKSRGGRPAERRPPGHCG